MIEEIRKRFPVPFDEQLPLPGFEGVSMSIVTLIARMLPESAIVALAHQGMESVEPIVLDKVVDTLRLAGVELDRETVKKVFDAIEIAIEAQIRILI